MEMSERNFYKVLKATDLAKLRIPKRDVNFFLPFVNRQNDTMLDVTDRNGRIWRFNLWNRNEVYAMTRGWSDFVKVKRLSIGDSVSFYYRFIPDNNGAERIRKILFIHWSYKGGLNLVHNPNQVQERECLGFDVNGVRYIPMGHNFERNLGRSEPLVNYSVPVLPGTREHPSSQASTTKKMRIFGADVEISSSSSAREDAQSSMRSPRGEMGASSSSKNVSDDENYKRKGKYLEL